MIEKGVKSTTPSFRNVQFDKFTDAQMHAELCHAECNLAKALLNLLVDDTGLVGLTKAAVAMKRVQTGYSLCRKMLDKGKFSTKRSKDVFAVGVYLGLGAVHLFLGSAPEKVLYNVTTANTHIQ